MRPTAPAALLLVSLLVVGCSSGSSATSAPESSEPAQPTAAASAEPTPEPAESASAEPSAAASAEPSADLSGLGSEFSAINSDMQQKLSAAAAKLSTATTPAAIAEVFSDYADAFGEAAASIRAGSWPLAISGDINTLADYMDEMASVYRDAGGDPTSIDPDRLAALGTEIPAAVQRIAAYFGVPVTN